MKDIKDLQKQELKLRNLIAKQQDKKEKELLPKYRKEFIGKCFKYRNSYGCDSQKWWLYIKILDVVSVNFYNGYEPVFKTVEIQKTSSNEITIKINEYSYCRNDNMPISSEEFHKEASEIIKNAINIFKE